MTDVRIYHTLVLRDEREGKTKEVYQLYRDFNGLSFVPSCDVILASAKLVATNTAWRPGQDLVEIDTASVEYVEPAVYEESVRYFLENGWKTYIVYRPDRDDPGVDFMTDFTRPRKGKEE